MEKVRKLKAVEHIGKIFAIYCLLLSSSYVRYLCDNPKAGETSDTTYAAIRQQVKILEKMLCFHDWLFSDCHDKETIDPDEEGNDPVSLTKIRELMHGIKLYFPRTQGMGWKLTKFHQLLHFPHNISRHGSALNFDGGRPEYYGKYFCKDLTTRTQRRQISLSKQTAQRYFESSCVLEAERLLARADAFTYRDSSDYQYIPMETNTARNTVLDDDHGPHRLRAKLCSISLDPDDDQSLKVTWSNKKFDAVDGFDFDSIVYATVAKCIWFSRTGGRLEKEGTLQCFSECSLPDGTVFRAHPLYNSERPWYDWVMVNWDDYGSPLPAKVMMLFTISSGDIENYNVVGDSIVPHQTHFLETGKSYALVKTVTGDEFNHRARNENTRFHIKSNIAVRYVLEKNMRLLEVEAIESIVLVLMDNVGALGRMEDEEDEAEETIIMFHDRSIWKNLFLEL
jgi:hypothetical protein